MKKSEARILVYLDSVREHLRYGRKISSKLGIDYGYTQQILNNLVDNGWVLKKKYNVKAYYFLKGKAPIKEAKEVLSK